MTDGSPWRWIAILAVLLSTIASAESLEDKVDRLAEQNERQQRELDEMRLKLAASQGESGADVAAGAMHRDILDLSVVDERVARALAEQSTPEIPGWLDGLVFKGDIRVRYEGQWFEDDDTFPQDRNRGRFRLRFGFTKTWSAEDAWKVEFRLASGAEEPSSANATFDTFFIKKLISIDRANIKWAPKSGVLKGLELQGGKFAVPFLHTMNLWDSDVNVEGIFEKYTAAFFDGALAVYGNFGQFVVNEHARSPADSSMLVYGGGVDFTTEVDWLKTVQFATNFYDFTHVTDNTPLGLGGNPITTLPSGRSFLAARDFDILDFVLVLKGKLFDVDYKLSGNYGLNTDVTEYLEDKDDDHWMIELALGRGKKKGDITLTGGYINNELNSVVGFWSDSDFGRAGNRSAYVRAFYNLTDFAKIGGSYAATDISPTLDEDVDDRHLLQVDLSIKF